MTTATDYASSLTKRIVSVAALALVEPGKLKLDDPLSKWIPVAVRDAIYRAIAE